MSSQNTEVLDILFKSLQLLKLRRMFATDCSWSC